MRCGINHLSCCLAPALYFCTVADARDEGSSKNTAHFGDTWCNGASVTYDRRDFWLLKDLPGCRIIAYPCPCRPALCSFIFRTTLRGLEYWLKDVSNFPMSRKILIDKTFVTSITYRIYYPENHMKFIFYAENNI